MSSFANTPSPPYYAVIFTSVRTDTDLGYEFTANEMIELAQKQPGFLGVESAREQDQEQNQTSNMGITVSYWSDLESIRNWKENIDHVEAQRMGCQKWYQSYKIRIAKVERDYGL